MIRQNQDIVIIIYCAIILWLNIDYLRDHKNIKAGLNQISEDDEMWVNPADISLLIIGIIFNFFRRWLIYLLAIVMTENIVVIIISLLLFVPSLYDTLFNYSLTKIKQSNIGLYLAIIDIVYISSFVVYIFAFK